MSTPLSPQVLKAGIVVLNPVSSRVLRVIALQYNPDQLSRTLQVQSMTGESADRSEALRLKGPPIETFKIEAEIDATDQLESAELGQTVVDYGIFPQLAALESLITPVSAHIAGAESLLTQGTLEIAPMQAPLAVFVWSAHRVAPVRVTEFAITEEAFDANLNPIRAKVSLSMRVLSVADIPSDTHGGALFMSYLRNKEDLALRAVSGSLDSIGLKAPP
jgi:hypothetical protein